MSLVNSTHIASFVVLPIAAISSFMVRLIRFGDSNSIVVARVLAYLISCVFALCFDFDRKPANRNLFAGSLEQTNAQVIAFAPGIAFIS
ncbi:hypothetical protein AADW59_00135 [Candidatus Hodgkinia cicadicola]